MNSTNSTNKVVRYAYASCGLATYVLDDGTWDGTMEGTWPLPTADIPYDTEDPVAEATKEFRTRGLI